jgi:glyoxylase-like metal-dependent hydrolase (beta-lactamase superfamily II)
MKVASSSSDVNPNEGFHQIEVGDVVVTALSDGFMKGGDRVVRGIDQPMVEATLRASSRFPANVDVNAFVIAHGDRKLLVDTGSGHYMGRNAGRLANNLEASGVSAEEIDTVLLTHIHPDHVGGLTEADGTARFPNAELLINSREYAFWMEGAADAWVKDEERALFLDCPREQIHPYMDRVRLISGDAEVFPYVTAMHYPGHTPGHSICMISSKRSKLLIWGDTVHVPEVQTAFPEAGVVFDVDASQAAVSRRKVFELAVSEQLPLLGMHTQHGGLFHLERDRAAFKLGSTPPRQGDSSCFTRRSI